MKKFNLLVTAVATMLATSVFAQNTSDKWYIGIGAHATDHTSVRGVFDGYFDTKDYSIVPMLSKLTVARSIAKNFAVDLQASVGSIDNKRLAIKDEFFVLAGLGLRWMPLSESQSLKWFDPYLRVGANYHKYSYDGIEIDENHPYTSYDHDYEKTHDLAGKFSGNDNNFVLNGGVGINFWFTRNFGLNIESQYNWATSYGNDYADFFQHSASLIFKFGAKKAEVLPPVPSDRDGDGIPDDEDRCPDTPGLAQFQGCPDTDNDGIPDIDDQCPTVPGPKENNGCPWPDTDGDGVLDKDDLCPTVPGPVENHGCPITPKEVNLVLKDINFKFNSAEITPESQTSIDKAVKLLAGSDILANGAYIDGHTDRVGSQTYNQTLSKKRAQSVVDALVKAGVDKTKLTARGFGKAQLKCNQADINSAKDEKGNILYADQAACDYANRRVEVLPKDLKVKVEVPATAAPKKK